MSSATYGVLPAHTAHNEDVFAIGAVAGGSWTPGANAAIYVPFVPPADVTAKRLFFLGDNTTGTIDVGIFAADGTRLVSTGSVTNATARVVTDVADTSLTAGTLYFLGISASSSSSNTRRATTGNALQGRATGLLLEASAHPLPATATLTGVSTYQFLPMFGFLTTASDL